MVVFYLRNSRSPDGKIVPLTVSLTLDSVKAQFFPATGTGFPNRLDPEGDSIWILTVATTEPDSSGNPIATEIVNVVSEETLHKEIEAAIGRIGNKVDWGDLEDDTQAPKLIELTPSLNQTTDVPITSNIQFRLQDPLPAAGLNLDTLNVVMNDFPIVTSGVTVSGFDVTLRGNVFDFEVVFRPTRIL